MNTGRMIFSQVTDHLPLHAFSRCVRRYRGHYKVKSFSCLDQYLCMAFGKIGDGKIGDRPTTVRLIAAT